jgi:hypothetical protein
MNRKTKRILSYLQSRLFCKISVDVNHITTYILVVLVVPSQA